MIEILQKEKELFKNFLLNSKYLIGIIFIIILITYGIKIFYFDFSIDTEILLSNYQAQISVYETQGRIGIALTKFLFFNGYFNPYLANILTYLNFFIVNILICFLINRVLGDLSPKSLAITILPILFATHPAFAEQFNFILQSFEVSLAIVLLTIALLLTYFYIIYGYKTFGFISILLCAYSILTYQSIILFFVSGAIACFILTLYVDERKNQIQPIKKYAFIGLKYFLVFVFSYILSQFILKIYYVITNMQLSEYITNQISWGKEPYTITIKNIIDDVTKVIFPNDILGSIFYNYGFLFSMLVIGFLLVWRALRKNKVAFIEIPAFIVLFLSPFLLTFYLGHGEVVRAQMPALQLVIAFNFYYIYLNLKNHFSKLIIIVISLITGINQVNVTANLFFSEHIKYEEDVNFANRLNTYLDQIEIGNRSKYSLVILGEHKPESVVNIEGETLGHSFFAWDIGTEAGTTYRALGFMRILGYKFKDPTQDEINYAHTIENELAVWPEKDSIRIVDHLIIIKISE